MISEKRKAYLHEYNKRYREEHKEKLKKFELERKEERKIPQQEYRLKNKEKYLIYNKEYKQKNKEKLKEYARKYRKNHKIERSECKRRHYLKHRERIIEEAKFYYKKNKENRKFKARKKRTGMSESEYKSLNSLQSGLCYICNRENTKGRVKVELYADHYKDKHGIKIPRKLLCDKCNFMIGHANESPDLLRKAAKYLEEFGMKPQQTPTATPITAEPA